MFVDLYVATIQTRVLQERDRIEFDYQRFPETNRFWCMIDLVGSSNYRLLHGPGKGYIRGETFFTLVRETTKPQSDVAWLKEMGDAVLLSSQSLRPLLESLVLVELAASQIEKISEREQFPFKIRGGISYGPAKQLKRNQEDFLGTSIDQLSRILGIRDSETNLFIHESAYRDNDRITEEYKDFLQISGPKQLHGKDSKNMIEPVYYREIKINHAAAQSYRGHFFSWQELFRNQQNGQR